jgi:hypothetical protein
MSIGAWLFLIALAAIAFYTQSKWARGICIAFIAVTIVFGVLLA